MILSSKIIMHEATHVRTVIHHQHREPLVCRLLLMVFVIDVSSHNSHIIIVNASRLLIHISHRSRIHLLFPFRRRNRLLSRWCTHSRHHRIQRRNYHSHHVALHARRQHIHLMQQNLCISQHHLNPHSHIIVQWFRSHLLQGTDDERDGSEQPLAHTRQHTLSVFLQFITMFTLKTNQVLITLF